MSIKNSFKNWNLGNFPVLQTCSTNSARLLNLVNLVCSTAQAANATARDACYGCFTRFVSLQQGQQQLAALSLCSTQYFTGTPYATCATRLATVVSSTAIFTPTNGQCTTGYCEFVRCLRRVNSDSVIAQCAREVRAAGAVNITIDNDNVRYFTNITSCVLAKSRCNLYNPITGEIQFPGVTTVNTGKVQTQVALYNTLQVTPEGTLRVVAFPSTVMVSSTFCSTQNSLIQSNWMNDQCP